MGDLNNVAKAHADELNNGLKEMGKELGINLLIGLLVIALAVFLKK